MKIYTIGHGKQPEQMIKLLRSYGITVIIDVRTIPYSRFVPAASQTLLKIMAKRAGLNYIWDKRLGGYGNVSAADRKNAVSETIELADKEVVAIMCSERDYRKCHRWSILTPMLVDAGIEVVHLEPGKKPVVQKRQQFKQLMI